MKQKLQEEDLTIDLPNDIINQHIAFLQSELYSIESINSWKGLLDEKLIKKYPHIYLRYALWFDSCRSLRSCGHLRSDSVSSISDFEFVFSSMFIIFLSSILFIFNVFFHLLRRTLMNQKLDLQEDDLKIELLKSALSWNYSFFRWSYTWSRFSFFVNQMNRPGFFIPNS